MGFPHPIARRQHGVPGHIGQGPQHRLPAIGQMAHERMLGAQARHAAHGAVMPLEEHRAVLGLGQRGGRERARAVPFQAQQLACLGQPRQDLFGLRQRDRRPGRRFQRRAHAVHAVFVPAQNCRASVTMNARPLPM